MKGLMIKIDCTEQEMMEAVLNNAHQVDREGGTLAFTLYALANNWNINKVIYYMNLINEGSSKKPYAKDGKK